MLWAEPVLEKHQDLVEIHVIHDGSKHNVL